MLPCVSLEKTRENKQTRETRKTRENKQGKTNIVSALHAADCLLAHIRLSSGNGECKSVDVSHAADSLHAYPYPRTLKYVYVDT